MEEKEREQEKGKRTTVTGRERKGGNRKRENERGIKRERDTSKERT